MSLVSQLRHRLPHVLLRHPILYHATAKYPAARWARNFAQQSARKEEEEDEGIEIDQRRLPADYDPSTFDPTEHHSPPTERVWRLVDEVSGLSLLEVAELSGILMKRLGSVVGVMSMKKGPTAGAAEEEKKPEKTVFELKLESYDAAQKIKIIKEVRGVTDLGLKEAKDLVEKSPAIFKKGVSKEEGEQIIEKMKAFGAKVVME